MGAWSLLFTTPLYRRTLPEHELLNAQLMALLDNERRALAAASGLGRKSRGHTPTTSTQNQRAETSGHMTLTLAAALSAASLRDSPQGLVVVCALDSGPPRLGLEALCALHARGTEWRVERRRGPRQPGGAVAGGPMQNGRAQFQSSVGGTFNIYTLPNYNCVP